MARHVASAFDTLRTWNGEQSRAFEELSFQLLKNRVPAGTHAIRTGNPDGGVEWYISLPDGTENGWQAKHVHGIDALLTAMSESVRRVAKERPTLRKLTFVISWNLATGKAGRQRKSQRQKYDDKIKTWKTDIPGASTIEFDLIQESDLLDELSKPEHNGRRWFWWGDLVFGHDWLKSRYQQQAEAASEKYRPDLQVDVPIQDELLAIGFDQSTSDNFHHVVRDVLTAISEVHGPPLKSDAAALSLHQAIVDSASEFRATAESLSLQAGDPLSRLDPLQARTVACQASIVAAEENRRLLKAAWRALPANDPQKDQRPSEGAISYGVRRLSNRLADLTAWLESPVGRCSQGRAYFLTGQAGSGKTHLLLDATIRSLDAGRPAIFLAGAQFGKGNLWASITDQLGLEPTGADILLRAMDAAGEASAVLGSRFIIFIDALNETTPADFWRTHLPALRSAVGPYPHIALVVSCRDTYREVVLEGTEASHYIHRSHPGFAEREVEATQRYFAHYGIEIPRFPLLTPEFTLPLFLRLYCESVQQSGDGSTLSGHQGRVIVFERYLAAKIAMVARRLRPTATSSYELDAAKSKVKAVLDALLDQLSRVGRESMSVAAAEEAAQSALDKTEIDETRVLGLFQEEGVFTRERLYLGDDGYGEGVRIVFQAFADFLLLRRRLEASDDPVNDTTLREWLVEDCSLGIREAATIVFPEVYGIEIPDLLELKLGVGPTSGEGRESTIRYSRVVQTYRSLVEMLPYRNSRAISQRTIILLNEAQPYLQRDEFYRVLFMLAPQPENLLNGDGLHRYLARRRMPQRDSDFGFATYHELFDPYSPAARLARWAAAGPYPDYDSEVIELACIPLCWLFSSPNRFMRDWVTKALVELLQGHLDVALRLFDRFWNIDDPYVVQRVVAVIYGSLLRSTPAQAKHAKALTNRIHDTVFKRPLRSDELLLDAARGVIRWAVAHDLLPDSAWDNCQRPYGLKVPGPAPTEATIEAKYPWGPGQPDNESYSSISFSLLSMGDFGRYVVESGLHKFSRYRLSTKYPDRQSRQPRLVKSRWKTFYTSLSDDQKRVLDGWLVDAERNSARGLDFLLRKEAEPLSEAQEKLLDAAFVRPKFVNDEYPTDAARRWVFRRTISLGWSPEIFGEEDRRVGRDRGGREAHKAERWGKKYQWMAYHELLARVADNYHASRMFADTTPYDGLHQFIGEREIDCSLPPIDFRAFSEMDGRGATPWRSPPIQLQEWPPTPLDMSRYRGDIDRFLADTGTEPRVDSSLLVRDRVGGDWIVLQSFIRQVDPLAPEGWRGLQQRSGNDSLLVTARDSQMLLEATLESSRRELSDLVDTHGHTDCCYVGEVGRSGPSCYHRHEKLEQVSIGNQKAHIVAAVEKYAWEGNVLDCSIGETASTVLPSTFLQQAAVLSFDMRGPSWIDARGTPVFTYYQEPGNESYALLVRASFLQAFLAEHDLELFSLHWFERMELSGDHRGRHPSIVSDIGARLTDSMALHLGEPKRQEWNLS